MKLDVFDWLAIALVIIGALNWGLIGILNFDLVAAIFGGPASLLSKIIYSLVGLAGAYLIYLLIKLKRS
jgi:uncharacterized membrane protein YuzA (DUF378 family)